MKKIITAINNPQLNEELKNEEYIEIVCKDIQYKEAVLEILENIDMVDLIIINENIPGEINLLELIDKIKQINKSIKIIVILEKENIELRNKLIQNNINDIYYNNKIQLKELIKIIKEKEINKEDEIKKELNELRKIIEKNNNIKEEKNRNNLINKIEERNINNYLKIKNNKIEKENNIKNISKKIISICGDRKVGKTILAIMIFNYLKNNNEKVCLLDINNNKGMNIALGIKEKELNNKNTKIIFNITENLKIENIKKIIQDLKTNYEYIILDIGTNNINIIKELIDIINKNIFLLEGNIIGINSIKNLINNIKNKNIKNTQIVINKKTEYTINKKIIQKCFEENNEILEINYNKKYDNLINNNFKIINNLLSKKTIRKIIK